MVFRNREDAGQQLAKQLAAYANRKNVVVLGIPGGGVPVAYEIAKALHAPLDIFLSRKLGVPGHEELAFGAIAAGDGRFIDEQIVQSAGISNEQIEQITEATKAKLEQRALLYRGGRLPPCVEGQIVILVDDGIATGASIYVAIHALRQMKPTMLVVAAPVAPLSTCNWLRSLVDELVVVYAPRDFYAVGQFYEFFSQVSDDEVIDLLQQAGRSLQPDPLVHDYPAQHTLDVYQHEVSIPLGSITLEGILSLPKDPIGLVIFAHGSGSSRHSPRNRYVAQALESKGLATLLFDLLTREEESVDRLTANLRFDIGLLVKRLLDVTQWAIKQPDFERLAIGYFGASTGAAAALVAASRLPELIAAVVSRGGRPDLAGEVLGSVRAPTLLIVGDLDDTVVILNQRALAKLSCIKQLTLVAGATHLFEEPGTLEKAAQLASDWFVRYLARTGTEKESGIAAPEKLPSAL
jgi:putative phosphoribosyl transferase